MTQTDAIRSWLEDGGSLTAVEALRMFGCLRLAARIDELRKSHDIVDEWEESGGKRWKRYRLAAAVDAQGSLFEGAA